MSSKFLSGATHVNCCKAEMTPELIAVMLSGEPGMIASTQCTPCFCTSDSGLHEQAAGAQVMSLLGSAAVLDLLRLC